MTDHQKIKALLDKLGLSYLDISKYLGMQYNSVKSQLAPSKELPKWAKTMLLVGDFYAKEGRQNKTDDLAEFNPVTDKPD